MLGVDKEYSWSLKNLGVSIANPKHSEKSTYNSAVSFLYPWLCIHEFNQLQIVQYCSVDLFKQISLQVKLYISNHAVQV